jgi:hypothetical protein
MTQHSDDRHDHPEAAHGHSLVPDNAPDPVETRDPASHPTPSRSRALLFALPVVALIAIGVGWMLMSETDSGGPEASSIGTSGEVRNDPEGGARVETLNPQPEGPRVIADMELLSSKADYVGRAVEIAAIPVMTKPGPRTFWAGRFGNRTLVLVDGSAQGADAAQPGATIRLSGRLERTPDQQALAQAGLDEQDREALEDEDVFIRAQRIEPQGDVGPLDAPTRQ